MFNRSKKGFTIVELIIVIAVIAVLAAVLIPTFSNLIQQAQEAKDTALVSELNKGLAMSGTKFDTMHDALTAVEENIGINVAKINATAAENEILWDSVNNCFVYLKNGNITYIPDTQKTAVKENEQYKYWQIVSTAKEDATYSQYLAGNTTSAVKVSTGFDAGNNTGITSVTYENKTANAQEVVIRTNGGAVSVDAPKDTVKHFGTADSVTITEVATSSYHEFGTVVGNIELASGRVVMESGSTAAAISVTATAEEITNGTATVAVDNTASNVSVVVPVEVKTAIEAKGGNNKMPTTNVVSDSETIKNMSLFAGGIGTEESPYLINNIEQWTNLAANSKRAGLSTRGKYFSVNCDLDFKDVTKQVQIQYFNGHITFNGHTVKNLQVNAKQCKTLHYNAYAFLFAYVDGNSSISDLTFIANSPKVDYSTKIVGYMNYTIADVECNLLLENVNVDGIARYSDNNTGIFVFWAGKGTLELKNCINYAYMVNQGGFTGAFVGRTYTNDSLYGIGQCTKLIFNGCENYGTIVNTTSSETHMLLSNYSQSDKTEIVVNNCSNSGTVIGSNIKLRSEVVNKGLLSTSAYKEMTIKSNKFAIDEVVGAKKYELTFSFSGSASGGGVASQTFVLTENDLGSVDAFEWIDIKDIKDTSKVVSEAKYGTTVKTLDGKYVFSDEIGTYIKKQPQVSLVVYGEDNTILLISTYSY